MVVLMTGTRCGRSLFLAAITMFLGACAAGQQDYRPPTPTPVSNSATVAKSKEEFWKQLVPALGREFFVISNLDKDSGIVNLSYRGNPQPYVDCA